jgi:hypothetical protein
MRFPLLKTILLGLLGALLLGAAPAAAVETGINQTMGQTKPTADTAAKLRAGWVRVWGGWDAVEPTQGGYAENIINDMNFQVNAAKARGLKVLMVMQRTPAWASGGKGAFAPPTDPSTFGRMMGVVAQRIPGVDAWELWNEPDEAEFFTGGPQPAKYAAMVKSAYPAIKAAQPHDTVVTGGLVANNMDYVEALYAHGIKGNFDALAVHTDTACLTNAPDFIYRDELGRIGRYTFTGYREVHAVMAAHGDGGKPIWMTELGWSTESTAPDSCSVGLRKGTKALGVTEEQQAQFLKQAFSCLAADPYIGVAFWFGMQDFTGSAHAGGYGLYRLNGSAKPAASAFAGLSGGIAPQACGGVIDTSGPEIRIAEPLDGARFVDVLPIDARAVDANGGVGIRRIEIWADGHFSRSFGDGHALMRSFWPVAHWKRGKHTLTFKAEDEAGNKTSRSITVTKLRKLPKVKTAAALALVQLDATTVRATGGVSSPKAHAAAKLRGKAFVVFQRKVADRKRKLKWKTEHRIGKRASRGIDVTKSLAPGTWRAYLAYPRRKGFKGSRSKPVVFEIAAPPAI